MSNALPFRAIAHATEYRALLAIAALLCTLQMGGCPPNESGDSNTPQASGPAVLLDGVDTGPDGLDPAALEAVAEISQQIPTDRSSPILLGGGALDAFRGSTTAKVRDRSAGNPACAKDQVAAALSFQDTLALNGIFISEFDDPIAAGPGDAAQNPAQPNGLAYVYGSGNPNIRAPGELPAVCQINLFGLDCSGFVSLCARESGVATTEWATTTNLNNPEYWNLKIPSSWGVTMVRIPFETPTTDSSTWTKTFTGDIAAFRGHVGFVVQTPQGRFIWNSAGHPDYSCAKNMEPHRGPTSWPIDRLLDKNEEGKPIYPQLLHVLRLVPNCAVDALSTGRDDEIGLMIEVELLKQERDADAAALLQATLACGEREPAEQARCAEDVLLSFKGRICERANKIACLTYRAALLELQSDTLLDLISTSRTFSNITFRDGSKCECALN